MKMNYRSVERIVKGFANHNRLKILALLNLKDLKVKINSLIGYENTSDHIRKMTIAGLVMKRNVGPSVCHKLTPRAQSILVFCKKLQ